MLKTVSSIVNAIGALNYKGTWDANTNNPVLTSSVGVKGDYYVVSVAGNTDLNGTTLWGVGDIAAFNGAIWQKIDGGDTSIVTDLTVTGLTGYMYANNTSPVTASLTIPNSGLQNSSTTLGNTVLTLGSTTTSVGDMTLANVTISSGSVTANVTSANVNITSATSNTAAMPDPSLPLNPEGYITIQVGGVAKKVPYYGV